MTKHVLPNMLPLTYRDAFRHSRLRDGYREQIRVGVNAAGGVDAIRRSAIGVGSDELEPYLTGDADMTLGKVSALIEHLGIRPTVGAIPAFDIFRSCWPQNWIEADAQLAKSSSRANKDRLKACMPPQSLENFGLHIWPMQPFSLQRSINAVLRRWHLTREEKEALSKGEPVRPGGVKLTVSPGGALLMCTRGSVCIEWLASDGEVENVCVPAGHAVKYRLSWPHLVRPLTADAETIEFCESVHGVPFDLMLQPYNKAEMIKSYPITTASGSTERPDLDSPRQHLSHALVASGIKDKDLAQVISFTQKNSGLLRNPERTLKALAEGVVREKGVEREYQLELEHCIAVARTLRIPEAHLFGSLREAELSAVGTPFKVADPQGSPKTKGAMVKSEEWSFGRIPSGVVGFDSAIEVRLLEIHGPTSDTECRMDRRKETRGERMLIVLEGSLEVKVGHEPENDFSSGTLNEGDSLWIQTASQDHGLWRRPKGPEDKRPVRALELRLPYAPGQVAPFGVPV